MPLEIIITLLAGLCFGSFITLASYRLPKGEDIVFKPSRCPQCSTALKIPDLFPVLSWLTSGGKCRHCKAPVHWRYPVIELLTALLFLLIYHQYGLSAESFCLMAFAVALMVMIVVDFEHYIIPDQVHYFLLPLGIAYVFASERNGVDALIGLLLGLVIGLTLCYGYKYLRHKDGLGLGDVKFLAVAGLWLGVLNIVPFLFLSGMLGIFTALVWRMLGKGQYFPFGPALAMALFICVVYPAIPALFWNAGMLLHHVVE